jgi:hypothetical protein
LLAGDPVRWEVIEYIKLAREHGVPPNGGESGLSNVKYLERAFDVGIGTQHQYPEGVLKETVLEKRSNGAVMVQLIGTFKAT